MNANTKPKLFYGYVIIIASFFMMLILWGTYDCFGIFFDSLITEFGWGRAETSGAIALNSITFGLASIPIARLCSRYSPRIVIAVCGVIMGVGYLLISRISAIWQLYLYYDVLIAIGMGAYISLLPIATRWFTKRRGFATGILFSGMGLGGVVFPLIANYLISVIQWRYSFAVMAAITIAGISIGAQFLRRDPRSMGLLPYGENPDENRDIPEAKTGAFNMMQAVHNQQFWLIGALYFTYLFCQIVFLTHIVIFALDINIDATKAAAIISVFGISQIAGMNTIGYIGDKIGNKVAVFISFVLTALSFIWLLAFGKDAVTLYIFAALLGFGSGGTQVLFSPIVAQIFGLESHGVILGSVSFVGSFGAALGGFSAGLIFDINNSYTLAFIICAVLAILAASYTWLLKPFSHKQNL
jgi:OFA family oxalate/formate antiporter-like MFS transporter